MRKIGRITIGLGLLLAGFIMFFTPGPGLITFSGGFIILMAEVPFVRRLGLSVARRRILPFLNWLSKKVPPASCRRRFLVFLEGLIQKRIIERFSEKDKP